MKCIYARNVNEAIVDGIWWLRVSGQREQSRNGEVLVAQGPVITEYACPEERVLFLPERDANPVFHLMEALWMLAGRSDVEPLLPFNARMQEYAELDGRIHGAYGARWAKGDQITRIVEILKSDPNSRQAVLQMWDSAADLGAAVRDKPCNTHVYFDARGGKLNMTVCCRSNDMLWGAYGANVVHFSVLQEVIAHGVGVPIGAYRQFSNNFHVYTDSDVFKRLWNNPPLVPHNPYLRDTEAVPLLHTGESYLDLLFDCATLFMGGIDFRTYFVPAIAYPLSAAYLNRRDGREWDVSDVPDCDWKRAFIEWTDRRDNASK